MNFRSSGGGCIFKSCDISLWPYFQEITLLFHMKIDEHALVTYSHKDIPLSLLWDWLSSSQVIQKLKAHKNMSPPPPSFLHTTLRQKWGEFFKSNIQLILCICPCSSSQCYAQGWKSRDCSNFLEEWPAVLLYRKSAVLVVLILSHKRLKQLVSPVVTGDNPMYCEQQKCDQQMRL